MERYGKLIGRQGDDKSAVNDATGIMATRARRAANAWTIFPTDAAAPAVTRKRCASSCSTTTPTGGIVTYSVGGTQYVAVTSGNVSSPLNSGR